MTETPPVVLIVDDSATNLHVLNSIMREHYRVKVARDGPRALAVAARDRPSLILLDVQMPDMDGPEVCRRLKQAPSTRAIPVIFISGDGCDDQRNDCLSAGGADFLVKPVDPDTLLATAAAARAAAA